MPEFTCREEGLQEADTLTFGGGGAAVTVRVADAEPEPPAPVQVTLWLKLPTLLAETLNEPLAPPLPTLQLVAWVDDQLKV